MAKFNSINWSVEQTASRYLGTVLINTYPESITPEALKVEQILDESGMLIQSLLEHDELFKKQFERCIDVAFHLAFKPKYKLREEYFKLYQKYVSEIHEMLSLLSII